MEVQFHPEIQARLEQLATESGRPADELVQDAMAGYFEELNRTGVILDRRYDETKSGAIEMLSREDIVAYFREKSAARRG